MSDNKPEEKNTKFQKFMTGGAGKGSGRRKEDVKLVRENWDDIKGMKPSKFK